MFPWLMNFQNNRFFGIEMRYFFKVKDALEMCGGILQYVAQTISRADVEIGKNSHF